MFIIYITRQLQSTEMQILSSLKCRGEKKHSSLKSNEEGQLFGGKEWSTNLTLKQIKPKFKFPVEVCVACAHMNIGLVTCLAACWASAWGHEAPGDSPVRSPHTRVLSTGLCSGMRSHPPASCFSLFCLSSLMAAVGCLIDWITGSFKQY